MGITVLQKKNNLKQEEAVKHNFQTHNYSFNFTQFLFFFYYNIN